MHGSGGLLFDGANCVFPPAWILIFLFVAFSGSSINIRRVNTNAVRYVDAHEGRRS